MTRFARRSSAAAIVGLLSLLSASCAIDGGYGGGVGYEADYYEPYGGYYGGWGDGYDVGPYRDGGYRGGGFDRGRGGGGPGGGGPGGHPGAHAFRPAPGGHSAPSLPSRSRSSGNRR